jgi:autophagy-related protein 2
MLTLLVHHSSSLPLLILGSAVDLRILLYGGYDWRTTRSAIESETDVLRRRLRKLSNLISSGTVPPPELRRTNIELFNSVHIGIRDEDEYEDDEQLLAAIDDELADLESETASYTTFKPHGSARSSGSPPKPGSAAKTKLRRSRRPQMEISLRDIAFQYSVDIPEADFTGSLKMTIQRTEIIDHIKSSTWKKFMTEMNTNGANGLEETDAKMLRVRVEWVNPGFQQASEARVNVSLSVYGTF